MIYASLDLLEGKTKFCSSTQIALIYVVMHAHIIDYFLTN